MKQLFTLVALGTLLCVGQLYAQQPSRGNGRESAGPSVVGKITGVVVDSLSGQPVEFATLVLIKSSDGAQIDGGISEEDGSFKIQNVKTGAYKLSVSFLGYEDKLLTEIVTTNERPDVNLGSVFLSPVGIQLDAVTVTAEAALIENRIDKLVYNAEKDASTAGGDAADVLRNVPMLSVDMDNNVSLRGSSNLQVLINGRPSTMFASNLAEALRTMPANQIKSVEVITTPGAKYDGEGSAGIINIITKKNNAAGFTGSVNSSIGTRQNDGGFNLNWVQGRFGLTGGLNGRWSWVRPGYSILYREDYSAEITQTLEQEGKSTSVHSGLGGNFGAYYDFNAYNSINSSLRLNGHNRGGDATLAGSLGALGSIDRETFSRFTSNEGFNNGFDWSTDYRRTFKGSEREFSTAFQLSTNFQDSNNETVQDSELSQYQTDLRNTNDSYNTEYTFQMDYVHPFGQAVKLETGAKAVLRRIESDYATQSRDNANPDYQAIPLLTDIFNYDQDVSAGYLSLTSNLGKKWSLVTGVRYEHTRIGGEYTVNEQPPFEQTYDNWLPNFILSKQFPDFSSIKFSYSQRIQRPSLRYINPFTEIDDPNNITYGNPALDPERVNQYELSYGTFSKGVSINAALYYRYTTDIIEGFTSLDAATQQAITTYLNIGIDKSVGINLFTSVKLKEIGNFRVNFNVYSYNASSTVEGLNLSNEAILWSGSTGGDFQLGKNWKLDWFGHVRSPRQSLQGRRASFWMYGFGVRKEFSKRLSLGVRIIDPLNKSKRFPNEFSGTNFYQRSDREIYFRSFGLNMTYNFGQLDFNSPNRGRGNRRNRINNDDQKGGDGQDF